VCQVTIDINVKNFVYKDKMRQRHIPDCSYFNDFLYHFFKTSLYQFRNIMTSSAKTRSSFQIDRGEGSLGSTVVDVGQVTTAANILTH
jgi:hypothetical protein